MDGDDRDRWSSYKPSDPLTGEQLEKRRRRRERSGDMLPFGTIYCVVDYTLQTNRIVYHGIMAGEAAKMLAPGTVIGSGVNHAQSWYIAEHRANVAREKYAHEFGPGKRRRPDRHNWHGLHGDSRRRIDCVLSDESEMEADE